jgi:photosystem II stability/assembly factor-like uncharacterized protein
MGRWVLAIAGVMTAVAQTWYPVGGVEPFVHRIVCPPDNPALVIVCADSMPPVAEVWRSNIQFFGGHGFRVSSDSGRSFSQPRLVGFSVRDLLLVPRSPQMWLAAVAEYASGGVVLSTDGGQTWQWTERPRCQAYVERLQVRTEPEMTFFAAVLNTNQGYRISRDTFATCVGDPNFPVQARDIAVVEDTVYLAADGFLAGGVWRSSDGGRTWQKDSLGLGNLRIWCLVPSRHQPGVLLCGADSLVSATQSVGRGIYRSEDGGRTWRLVGAAGVRITALAEHPTDPRYWVAAGDTTGVWVSGSYGTAWERHADGLPAGVPVRTVALPAWDTRGGVVAFAGLTGGGLYRSRPILTTVENPAPQPKELEVRLAAPRELLVGYTLSEAGWVRWELVDIIGRVVAVSSPEWRGAGRQLSRWEVPERLAPGWYALSLVSQYGRKTAAVLLP